MRRLASSFVPIADADGFLRHADSEEGRFYRALLGEIDRFAGPSGNLDSPARLDLQGIYCFTPSGTLLAAALSTDPREVAAALKEALSKWEVLDPKKRLFLEPIRPFDATMRPEPPYPEDGLVLLQSMRDLPRLLSLEPISSGPWNKDYVWFKKSEARLLLPEKIQRGARYEVPAKLVKRLATVHFVDQVRGASEPFEPLDVDRAKLTATVEDVEGRVALLRFEGSSRAAREGRWPVDGERDRAWPSLQKRGVELSILGRARYDLKSQRFTAFELVAIGRRWGGTQWNGRADDLADGPIGFAFAVAPGHPVHRAAPHALASWGRTYWTE